jgi:hypothetical protein
MQPEKSTHLGERERNPEHMPLGEREVPLLAHEHPPLNFARQHHAGLPHHGEPGYAHYQTARKVALANGIKSLEESLSSRTPVKCLVMSTKKLIVQYHSQSKLSQQELADLQKATHFDKKELQQWYKGMAHADTRRGVSADEAQVF